MDTKAPGDTMGIVMDDMLSASVMEQVNFGFNTYHIAKGFAKFVIRSAYEIKKYRLWRFIFYGILF